MTFSGFYEACDYFLILDSTHTFLVAVRICIIFKHTHTHFFLREDEVAFCHSLILCQRVENAVFFWLNWLDIRDSSLSLGPTILLWNIFKRDEKGAAVALKPWTLHITEINGSPFYSGVQVEIIHRSKKMWMSSSLLYLDIFPPFNLFLGSGKKSMPKRPSVLMCEIEEVDHSYDPDIMPFDRVNIKRNIL